MKAVSKTVLEVWTARLCRRLGLVEDKENSGSEQNGTC